MHAHRAALPTTTSRHSPRLPPSTLPRRQHTRRSKSSLHVTGCLKCATQQLQQQLIRLAPPPTERRGSSRQQHQEEEQQQVPICQQQQQQQMWGSAHTEALPAAWAGLALAAVAAGHNTAPAHRRSSSRPRTSSLVFAAVGGDSGDNAPPPAPSSRSDSSSDRTGGLRSQPQSEQQQQGQQPPFSDPLGLATDTQQQRQQQQQASADSDGSSENSSSNSTSSSTNENSGVDSPGVRAALAVLKWYKGFLSPSMASTCRFQPTCSQYSMDSYRKYGIAKGTVLTAWRLLRCNPWGGSGYDPTSWPPVGLAPLFALPYSAEVAVVVGTALVVRFTHALLFE